MYFSYLVSHLSVTLSDNKTIGMDGTDRIKDLYRSHGTWIEM